MPPQPPIELAPEPAVLPEPEPVLYAEPEPVVFDEPVVEPDATRFEPMGWDPGAAPPPAGPPIVVDETAAQRPVSDLVTPEVVETPDSGVPVYDAPVFEPVDDATFEHATFEPVFDEPELSVFDPNEFEVPFEPLVGASDLPDPVVILETPHDDLPLEDRPLGDLQSAQAAAAAWPEPEVVPPAFDPNAPEPPAATPAEPYPSDLGEALFEGGADDLPRRIPGASPLGTEGETSSLPTRSPGRHLSHQPAGPPA